MINPKLSLSFLCWWIAHLPIFIEQLCQAKLTDPLCQKYFKIFLDLRVLLGSSYCTDLSSKKLKGVTWTFTVDKGPLSLQKWEEPDRFSTSQRAKLCPVNGRNELLAVQMFKERQHMHQSGCTKGVLMSLLRAGSQDTSHLLWTKICVLPKFIC